MAEEEPSLIINPHSTEDSTNQELFNLLLNFSLPYEVLTLQSMGARLVISNAGEEEKRNLLNSLKERQMAVAEIAKKYS